MQKKLRILFFILLAAAGVLFFVYLLSGHSWQVLNPMGTIALKERNLMQTALILMLIIVIPVFILTFTIAWKYRASNTKATYTPNWDKSAWLETIWWGFPCLIILILAVVTWNSSHDLDPFKPINASSKAITIQVVSLDWKWLFIYPDQDIATVNYVQFPENTPVNFVLTSDAPMNSFWIPQLGGQVYTMPGMSMQLHLIATQKGSFNGSSANLSGRGFAGMKFIATSSSQADFDTWVQTVKKSAVRLSLDEYMKLAEPSENTPVHYYSSNEPGLYDTVVLKYMGPDAAIHAVGIK